MRIQASLCLMIVALVGSGLALTACKKKSKDDDDDDDVETTTINGGGSGGSTTSTETVPQVGAISLSTLGDTEEGAALHLVGPDADGKFVCNQSRLGFAGIVFGTACQTSPMASRMMLGRDDGDFNGDGVIDCNDFHQAQAENKDAGLMLHLLCEEVMLSNDDVVSLAFTDAKSAFAVGFTDFPNDTTAAGSWTHGNAASYPADIRIWRGATMNDLKGEAALGLTDVNNGTIFLDSNGQGGGQFQGAVTFSNKLSTGDCVTSPSTDTCHYQDVRMYTGEGEVTFGPPNSLHVRILADDKAAPTFIAIEGSLRFSAATASRFAKDTSKCPGSAMANIRTLYFQGIQKGDQVWSHMAGRDANGNMVSCVDGGFNPFTAFGAAEGVCLNRGSPFPVACSDIDPTEYASLWEGESTFDAVTESPIGAIWDGAPTQTGLCTTTGCSSGQ